MWNGDEWPAEVCWFVNVEKSGRTLNQMNWKRLSNSEVRFECELKFYVTDVVEECPYLVSYSGATWWRCLNAALEALPDTSAWPEI